MVRWYGKREKACDDEQQMAVADRIQPQEECPLNSAPVDNLEYELACNEAHSGKKEY